MVKLKDTNKEKNRQKDRGKKKETATWQQNIQTKQTNSVKNTDRGI